MKLTRRAMLAPLGGAGLLAGADVRRAPNVVFILTDDLGIGDLRCYGSREIETPNIDRLAAGGIRFTNYYAASAVCSPTRASCLTGRYPLRFGITKHFEDREEHLPSEARTLAEVLKSAGYFTAHVGKWHLGGLNRKHIADRAHSIPGPREHGFEHYLCMAEDPAERAPMVSGRTMYSKGARHLVRNEAAVPPSDQHLVDFETDEANRLLALAKASGRPFYLNLWYDAPHTPYEAAPEPHLSKHRARAATGDTLLYRSMVSHLDASVGRVLKRLDELGLSGNTLVVFASDNGPSSQGSAGRYKGRKADLHEGGIRVPLIVSWPGRIRPGQTASAVCISTDLMPTICDAAGIAGAQLPRFDGQTLLPLAAGQARRLERDFLLWQMDLYETNWQEGDGPVLYRKPKPYSTEAIREGNWKLLCRGGEPQELFDLGRDPDETRNLVAEQTERVKRMTVRLQEWLNEPRLSPLR